MPTVGDGAVVEAEVEGDSDAGFMEQRSRMGVWNAIVELRTSRRKKRYCRISGWAWRRAALVCVFGSCGILFAGEVEVEVEDGVVGALDCWDGRESFSMRAQVR